MKHENDPRFAHEPRLAHQSHSDDFRSRLNFVLILVAVSVVVGSAVLTPLVVGPTRGDSKRAARLNNLKQIANAHSMYAADSDGRLAPCRAWQDSLEPYIRTREAYTDPTSEDKRLGFAMNMTLDGAETSSLESPSDLVLHFATTIRGPNAVGSTRTIRANGKDGKSALVCYVDMKVKWTPVAR